MLLKSWDCQLASGKRNSNSIHHGQISYLEDHFTLSRSSTKREILDKACSQGFAELAFARKTTATSSS